MTTAGLDRDARVVAAPGPKGGRAEDRWALTAETEPRGMVRSRSAAGTGDRSRARRLRVFGPFAALLLVPWSVQTYAAGGVTLLFPWGLVNADPASVTTLYDFLFRYTAGLPDFVLAWPLSVVCYLLAFAVAVGGRFLSRPDDRLTAGLLAVAGVAQLTVAGGFAAQPGRTAWPVGTVALWAAAWVVYGGRASAARS